MKKIIILLMAVSIMLTSCGKSAGLSNSDKRADNNTPPPASSSFKGNPPQITDGKNSIIQPLTGFVNEYKKAIALTAVAVVIAVGAFFAIKLIINKESEPPKESEPLKESEPPKAGGLSKVSEPPEAKGQSEPKNQLEPSQMIDMRLDLGWTDYETIFLSCPDRFLTKLINSEDCLPLQMQYATAELERRNFVPFSISADIDSPSLVTYSSYPNKQLTSIFDDERTIPKIKKAIEFILKVRRVIA